MTELEWQILDFETKWWKLAGNKESEIVRRFEMSVIRYAQKLNNLLGKPEAHQHNPLVVNRLLRIRDQRVTERAQRKNIT